MINAQDKMDKIISLAKRRGFVYPGSEIYGGLQNSWDFGPLGAEIKMNIKTEWWNYFVRSREDMVGIDSALIMNNKVWESSGHLANFTDPLSECKKCHHRFRTDHLKGKDCPDCGGELSDSRQFNMMLKTFLGAAEDKSSEAYFRPETAQGMFVNFNNIIDSSRMKLPFGIAQIGKAFRNEITPGNYIFRTREFEQMEIEYFIPVPQKDSDWQQVFEDWRIKMQEWIHHLGIRSNEIYELDVAPSDLAHYSKKTIDFEYKFPFGQKELYGLAYRTDFDLKNHNLKYRDQEADMEYTPHVIEPTFGVERTVLAAMCSAYTEEDVSVAPSSESLNDDSLGRKEEEQRIVMKFPKWLAPVKVAILPLSKKEELSSIGKRLANDLRKNNNIFVLYDETQSIGKRYRRQDEIGTPYCVTIDFDSINDGKATIRDRDTMQQERVNMTLIKEYIQKQLAL